MPKKTKQLWLIPFYGSYQLEVDKDEGYDSDEIENLFWTEYVGHVQFGDVNPFGSFYSYFIDIYYLGCSGSKTKDSWQIKPIC